MWIAYLCALIVAALWGFALYGLMKERKLLKAEILDLLKEIDGLRQELALHVFTSGKVELTLPEKRMILDALEFPQYKARVTDPKAKRFIRIIYNTLRTKIKDSIKETK